MRARGLIGHNISAGLLGLLGLVWPLAALAGIESSSLWSDSCETLYADENQGDISQLCAGKGGYRLIVHESDLRQSVDVVDASGMAWPLELWRNVSGAFSSVDDSVDWLVNSAGNATALALRFSAASDVEGGAERAASSHTVLVKLAAQQRCITAVIEGFSSANDDSLSEQLTAAASGSCIAASSKQLALTTLQALSQADRGCELTPEGHNEPLLGDYELCEQTQELTNQPAYLSYAPMSVQAARCEGRTDCDDSELVHGVSRITVRESEHCSVNEVPVFACDAVAACWSREQEQFSVALGGHSATFSQTQLSGDAMPFAGGGGAWLTADNGHQRVTLYSGVGRWGDDDAPANKAGATLLTSEGAYRQIPCRSRQSSIIGPVWFEERGIEQANEEVDFAEFEVTPW